MERRKRLIFALAMFVAYVGFVVFAHHYKLDSDSYFDVGSSFSSSSSSSDDDESTSISSSSAGDDDDAGGGFSGGGDDD